MGRRRPRARGVHPDRAGGARADDRRVWSRLGGYALQDGRHDAAHAYLRHAVAYAPGDAASWTNLGTALLHLARADEAIAAYRRALALDPGAVGARVNLGNALERPATSTARSPSSKRRAGSPRTPTRSSTISATCTRSRADSTTRLRRTMTHAAPGPTSASPSRTFSRLPSSRHGTRRPRCLRCTGRIAERFEFEWQSGYVPAAELPGSRAAPARVLRLARLPYGAALVRRARAPLPRPRALRRARVFQQFAAGRDPGAHRADRLASDEGCVRRAGRAVGPRRRRRHPYRHRRPHRPQPARGLRTQACARADDLARLPQHHRPRVHRLSADRRGERPAGRERCAAQRDAAAARAGAVVLEPAHRHLRAGPAAGALHRPPDLGSFNNCSKLTDATLALWARVLAAVPRARLVVVGAPPGAARARIEAAFGGAHDGRVQVLPRLAARRVPPGRCRHGHRARPAAVFGRDDDARGTLAGRARRHAYRRDLRFALVHEHPHRPESHRVGRRRRRRVRGDHRESQPLARHSRRPSAAVARNRCSAARSAMPIASPRAGGGTGAGLADVVQANASPPRPASSRPRAATARSPSEAHAERRLELDARLTRIDAALREGRGGDAVAGSLRARSTTSRTGRPRNARTCSRCSPGRQPSRTWSSAIFPPPSPTARRPKVSVLVCSIDPARFRERQRELPRALRRTSRSRSSACTMRARSPKATTARRRRQRAMSSSSPTTTSSS